MTSPLGPLQALLEGTPDAAWLHDEAWRQIPAPLRPGYARQAGQLITALSTERLAPVDAFRSALALAWEIECLLRLQGAGVELSPSAQTLRRGFEHYPRYAPGQDLALPPQAGGERIRMQNDVPVWDAGRALPWWVETKCMVFRPYGHSFRPNARFQDALDTGTLNQLLKYQRAVEQGWVAGATVLLRGRLHPKMGQWMARGLDGQGSRIPDVEVAWDCPQPDGSAAWVVLKPARAQGLVGAPPVSALAQSASRSAWETLAASPHAQAQLLTQGSLDADPADPLAWPTPTLECARVRLAKWRADLRQAMPAIPAGPSPSSAPRP